MRQQEPKPKPKPDNKKKMEENNNEKVSLCGGNVLAILTAASLMKIDNQIANSFIL